MQLPKGITKRKDNIYVGRFSFDGQRIVLYDRDWRKLDDKITTMKYELKQGIYVKEQNMTVQQWFDTWIESKELDVKPSTIQSYEDAYNDYIKKKIGNRKLKSVRVDELQRVYDSMAKAGYKKNTIMRVNTVLKGMFKKAYKQQVIKKNNMDFITIPKLHEDNKVIALTVEQQKLFLEKSDGQMLDMAEIFLSTGMRSGELRGLDFDTDIDFKNRVIKITGTLVYVKGKMFKQRPKTKKGEREIPMLDNVYKILRRIKRQQAESKLMMGDKWTPYEGLENLVFTRPENGKPISTTVLSKRINTVCRHCKKKDADFPNVTPHVFRHTFATRCIENGMPPQVLKEILGHSKLSMTMDLYAHVLPNTKKEEMKKIAGLF
ncbi:MAG: tyrosine-type recombinase/integrase [Anaerostipes sp.]|nr:tyrosine-type recombinase/integrase [Anaerostipes sp.]